MSPAPPRLASLVFDGDLHTVFQPIVDLDAEAVVGYEALTRGPAGTALESPLSLFAAARAAGCLAELDAACRRSAFRTAIESGLLAPLTLFVNVEPEVLDDAPLGDLLQIAGSAPRDLRVVFEITERAIAARPAELLRTVERIRAHGWAVALDDVGADPASLAFMSLLRPEVVKLDLRLIQTRPDQAIAAITHAVNSYVESSGRGCSRKESRRPPTSPRLAHSARGSGRDRICSAGPAWSRARSRSSMPDCRRSPPSPPEIARRSAA